MTNQHPITPPPELVLDIAAELETGKASMTDLSPAAQAVLDTAFSVYDEDEHLYVVCNEQHAAMIAAAALRALAIRINGADDIRQDVLDIAAELEGITR